MAADLELAVPPAPPSTPPARVRRKMTRKERKNAAIPYLLLLPALLVVALVVAGPIAQSIGYSFQHYNLRELDDVHFAGLENYQRALTDGMFWRALRATLIWVGAVLPLQFVIGLAIATLMNRAFKGRLVLRAAVLLPWIVPSTVVALLWRWMLDGNLGVVNDVLVRLGVLDTGIPWLNDPNTAMAALVLAMVWHGMPFFALMLLAALQAVPTEMYEAAGLDGASPLQRFRYITWPTIIDTIRTTTLLRIIWLANSIEIIWIMTSGGPNYGTTTLPVVTFFEAMRGLDFGYASAVSILLTLLLMGVVVLYLRRMRKDDEL
jgi:multiple sugar transport system permease protein